MKHRKCGISHGKFERSYYTSDEEVVALLKIIRGLGGPKEDHQLHHCCWTGRVSEREEEEED